MKDSGIEWIGEIPEGWEVATIGHLFSVTAGGDAKPHLYSYVQDTKHPYPVYTNSSNPNQIYAYTSVPKFNENTITVTGRGDIGHAFYRNTKFDAIIRLLVLAPKSALDCRYYAYWIDNVSIFFTNSAAVGQLSAQQIFPYKTCYLPLCEQHSIANHLDFYCSKIEHILADIQNSIQEYKKLKQAVITQAVTKGVRGEREMKDSGVEWIGEIPAEWRKTQLRHCATIKSGITLGKNYSKDTVLIERPYLRVANVQGGYVDLNDLATIEVTPDEDLKYRLHSGDVLMTEGGDRDKLGRGCVWHGEIEPCLHQNHVFAVQTNETILLPEFLEYLTASDVGRSYFDVTAIKTTNLACTSSSKVLAFTIPLPSIEEQIEIVDFIKKRSLELNKLIMKKELLVQELESYKKSLIYEVVTGKREV